MKRASPRRVIRRQPARLLALTGLGVLIAAFFAAAATSGQATHFDVTVSPSAPTAGSEFTATIRALDATDDVDKSYKGNHILSFSGPLDAPDGTPPLYPANPAVVAFDQGVATVPVTLFNAALTTLTATEASTGFTGSLTDFTVNPGAPAELTFTTQPPVWVAKNVSFPAAVLVEDDWGNDVPNTEVSITLNKHASALSCPSTPGPCTATSGDPSGIANFSLSVSKDAIGYELVASAGDATPANSSEFSVADQYGTFDNGNGPSGQDDLDTTLTSTSVNGSAGNNLALAVDETIPINYVLCGGLQAPVGSGTVFEVVKSTQNDPQPTWTATITVKKAALVDTARGAATYDVCLGTRNLHVADGIPPGTDDCLANSATSLSTSLSWPAEGGCAVPDENGVYWGNVLNAGEAGTNTPAKIKNCSEARAPVVLSKNKTGPGNLVIKFCVPWPWDGFGGSH